MQKGKEEWLLRVHMAFDLNMPVPNASLMIMKMDFSKDLEVKTVESQNDTSHSENFVDDKQKWYRRKEGIAFIVVGILVLLAGLALLLSSDSSASEAAKHSKKRNFIIASPSDVVTQINTYTDTDPDTDTETENNVGNMDMSELIYFLKRTDDDWLYDLYSVKPDGSEIMLRHEKLFRDKYVVSNDGKTLLFWPKRDLYSVDLAKGSGKSKKKEKVVLELKSNEQSIYSLSLSSDGSKLVFATSLRKGGFNLQLVQFSNGKWSKARNIFSIKSSEISGFKLSPTFSGEYIFLIKTSNTGRKVICKIDLTNFDKEEEWEELDSDFNSFSFFLASNGDRYAYTREGTLLIKTFGSQMPATRFSSLKALSLKASQTSACRIKIPSDLTIHKWEDDLIYCSFSYKIKSESKFPLVKPIFIFLHCLNLTNGNITPIRDGNGKKILVV